MPKDDYLQARRNDIARKSHLWTDENKAHEARVAAFLKTAKKPKKKRSKKKRPVSPKRSVIRFLKENSKDFPAHELIEQPDGSLKSPVYTFDRSRWS